MEQKAHRWPQSAQLHPEQPERRAERHRSLHRPPSMSLSLSPPLSVISPFTVIRAFHRFLFSQEWIVGDNLWLLIGWLHTKSGPGKRAFVAAATQNPAASFSFSPAPQRHTYHATPSAKKRKEKEWHIEKRKPSWPPLLHSTWLALILRLVAKSH